MAIPVATVNFSGPAPVVRVIIGNALPATYTIGAFPNHNVSQGQTVFVALTPAAVAAPHDLNPVWPQMSAGWMVSVFGGIGGVPGNNGFPLKVTLTQDGQTTDFDVMQVQSSSSSTFVAMIELA